MMSEIATLFATSHVCRKKENKNNKFMQILIEYMLYVGKHWHDYKTLFSSIFFSYYNCIYDQE